MAQTPDYWRTLDVRNDSGMPVILSVTFGDNETGHHVIRETHKIGAGETYMFPEQQYEEGGWTSVASVQAFDAQCVQGGILGARQSFHPRASAGVERAHQVRLSCAPGGIDAKF
jgi:hypothetical protein